jgi:hypothetical protein
MLRPTRLSLPPGRRRARKPPKARSFDISDFVPAPTGTKFQVTKLQGPEPPRTKYEIRSTNFVLHIGAVKYEIRTSYFVFGPRWNHTLLRGLSGKTPY